MTDTRKDYNDTRDAAAMGAANAAARESHRTVRLWSLLLAAEGLAERGLPRRLYIPGSWFDGSTDLNDGLREWIVGELRSRGFTVRAVPGVLINRTYCAHGLSSDSWAPLTDAPSPLGTSAQPCEGLEVTWPT